MATNQNTENVQFDTMAHFDRVAAHIDQTFNRLIAQLIARREALLAKVLQLREAFHNKESARKEALEELEKTQEHLKQLSLKANLNIPVHQQASHAYEQGMKQLATPTKLPPLFFSSATRGRIGNLIEEFGELLEQPNYPEKKEPILTAGKEGKGVGEIGSAKGLALDEANQIIYICDFGNRCIQKFSFQAKFIGKFGEDKLKEPWGATVTQDHIFITDPHLHSLFRYDKNTLQLLNRAGGEGGGEGKLDAPRGIAVDTNGDVFVADNGNNRVSIFSKELNFLSCIGQGKLEFPQDIKLTTESVVVLDWNNECVHFFTRNGDLLSSCVARGINCLVYNPFFFCLDGANNLIISEWSRHDIKILGGSGELIHTIGRQGEGIGEFMYPSGIAISDAGTIWVVSNNPNFALQCF